MSQGKLQSPKSKEVPKSKIRRPPGCGAGLARQRWGGGHARKKRFCFKRLIYLYLTAERGRPLGADAGRNEGGLPARAGRSAAADASERRLAVGFGRTATREVRAGTGPPPKLTSVREKPVTDQRSAHHGRGPVAVSPFNFSTF
jgi:hypothetical protein